MSALRSWPESDDDTEPNAPLEHRVEELEACVRRLETEWQTALEQARDPWEQTLARLRDEAWKLDVSRSTLKQQVVAAEHQVMGAALRVRSAHRATPGLDLGGGLRLGLILAFWAFGCLALTFRTGSWLVGVAVFAALPLAATLGLAVRRLRR